MDFSAEAQSLVDTFSAISNPTTEDISTLTLSMSELLNTEGITQDQIADVINIMTTLIATNSTLSADFTLSVETVPMSDDIYAKFLNAASGLESQEGTEYDALLTLYTNLNYSNYMTLMIDADTVTSFYDNLMIYLGNCLEDDQVLSLKTPILDTLSSNAVDSSLGMARNEFILACKDILALLFSYFTLDEINYIKKSFESFITMNFLNVSTYATTMALSGASTLTSTVSTDFGITSIPLTPENSELLIEEASNFFLIYPFTDEQISEIIVAMTSYFTSLEYTMGLSAVQVGGAWSAFEAVATAMITDTSLYTACQWLCYLKTSFASITTAAYTKGITNLLPSLAYFDSWAIEDLYYTNPLVATDGIMPIAGNFLSDWLDTFSENLSAKVVQPLSDVLKVAITDLIKTENNAVYRDGLLRGYAVSAQNFIQIGIEILLFLSHFMEQSDLDEMALKLTDFLISILYVSTFIDDSWDEINIIVQVIVAVVILALTIFLSVFSGGAFMIAVGAFFSTLASGSTGAAASAAAASVVAVMIEGATATEGFAAGVAAATAYAAAIALDTTAANASLVAAAIGAVSAEGASEAAITAATTAAIAAAVLEDSNSVIVNIAASIASSAINGGIPSEAAAGLAYSATFYALQLSDISGATDLTITSAAKALVFVEELSNVLIDSNLIEGTLAAATTQAGVEGSTSLSIQGAAMGYAISSGDSVIASESGALVSQVAAQASTLEGATEATTNLASIAAIEQFVNAAYEGGDTFLISSAFDAAVQTGLGVALNAIDAAAAANTVITAVIPTALITGGTTISVADAGVYSLCSEASSALTSTATGAITSSTINFLANANLSDTSTTSCET